MSIMEISEALKRGTVDAVCTAPGYGLGAGMTDVTKYISYWPVQSGYGGDIQKILKEVSRQMQAQVFFSSDSEYRVARKGIEVAGLETIVPDKAEIDKARQLAKPAITKWVKIAGPRAEEVLAIAADYASGAKIMLAK
jgi:TRAP-type C4-dicarboxylate transport system substrate-binding protein